MNSVYFGDLSFKETTSENFRYELKTTACCKSTLRLLRIYSDQAISFEVKAMAIPEKMNTKDYYPKFQSLEATAFLINAPDGVSLFRPGSNTRPYLIDLKPGKMTAFLGGAHIFPVHARLYCENNECRITLINDDSLSYQWKIVVQGTTYHGKYFRSEDA